VSDTDNTGKHNLFLKTNSCFLCIFHAEFKHVIRIALSPTVFCGQNIINVNVDNLFFVTLPMSLKYGRKLNCNKDSRYVSPITDSRTVPTQTCTNTLGHETNVKFCFRNFSLLVV